MASLLPPLAETAPGPRRGALSEIPPEALHFGFINKPVATHLSKTLMLPELSALFAAAPVGAQRAELRRRVVEDNVLLKSTMINRVDHFKRLSSLYGLDPGIPLYRLLRASWEDGPEDRPLQALLIAVARDPLLRSTAAWVLSLEPGALAAPAEFSGLIAAAFPDRYSLASLRSAGQNLAASWRQAGFLAGKVRKVRARAAPGPVSAALALYLAHLAGERGLGLFDSLWARLLDVRADERHELAFRASQRGLLEYRRIGEVVEVGFSRFERRLAAPVLGETSHG